MRFTALKKAMALLPRPPLALIDGALIDDVFAAQWRRHHDLIDHLLTHTSESVGQDAGQEQALPGNPEFRHSGHYTTMLKRYLFAAAFFCKKKRVLDSCCGLGWGSFLLALHAGSVLAFDRSENALAFCRQTWKAPNVAWLQADALCLDGIGRGGQFDVACAMETIEHFSKADGERYISALASVLHTRGVLIGTSSFPPDRKRADEICARNPHHLYIFTISEMRAILKKFFSTFVIIDSWMFIARK